MCWVVRCSQRRRLPRTVYIEWDGFKKKKKIVASFGMPVVRHTIFFFLISNFSRFSLFVFLCLSCRSIVLPFVPLDRLLFTKKIHRWNWDPQWVWCRFFPSSIFHVHFSYECTQCVQFAAFDFFSSLNKRLSLCHMCAEYVMRVCIEHSDTKHDSTQTEKKLMIS